MNNIVSPTHAAVSAAPAARLFSRKACNCLLAAQLAAVPALLSASDAPAAKSTDPVLTTMETELFRDF